MRTVGQKVRAACLVLGVLPALAGGSACTLFEDEKRAPKTIEETVPDPAETSLRDVTATFQRLVDAEKTDPASVRAAEETFAARLTVEDETALIVALDGVLRALEAKPQATWNIQEVGGVLQKYGDIPYLADLAQRPKAQPIRTRGLGSVSQPLLTLKFVPRCSPKCGLQVYEAALTSLVADALVDVVIQLLVGPQAPNIHALIKQCVETRCEPKTMGRLALMLGLAAAGATIGSMLKTALFIYQVTDFLVPLGLYISDSLTECEEYRVSNACECPRMCPPDQVQLAIDNPDIHPGGPETACCFRFSWWEDHCPWLCNAR